MNKFLKISLFTLGSILGLLVLFLISVLIFSGNKPTGGTKISEKGWFQIGGIKQGYFLRGEDPKNPVLLFLHGGPGSPTLPIIKDKELEQDFTICYWDQRGSGMTYSSSTDPKTININQMVEDTKEIADSLRKRYGVEKIYLMGHSWGTYLGIKTIEKYADRFYAYIGVGQISHQLESERIAYDYLMEQASKVNDSKTIKGLRQFDKNSADFPTLTYLFSVRTPAMNKYGVGILHKDFSMFKTSIAMLYYRGYTLCEKINYIKGALLSSELLFPPLIQDNLIENAKKLDVPTILVQGQYDYQVSTILAKTYFDSIQAPYKEFHIIENTAHSPYIENPKKFVEIMRALKDRGNWYATTRLSLSFSY